MQLLKVTILIAFVLLYASCTKKDIQSAKASDNACFTTGSTINGTVIDGQYIISYKSTSAGANLSAEQLKQEVRALILGGKLNSASIKASFVSGGGGFMAGLTNKQVEEI